jgi:hypothetical protein
MNLSAAKLAYLLDEMAHSTAGVYVYTTPSGRVARQVDDIVFQGTKTRVAKMRNATARSASQISARSAAFSLSLVTTSGDNLPFYPRERCSRNPGFCTSSRGRL